MAGCATISGSNPPFTTAAVQADPQGYDASIGALGTLQVFTATSQNTQRAGFIQPVARNYQLEYPHGGWRAINNTVIENPSSIPKKLKLAPGRYTIKAMADINRVATVPVVITAGNTTVVNLRKADYPAASPPPDKAVQAPDGYIVGWRAD